MGATAEGEERSEETLVNWTEILRKGGVPDAPGYQELQALMREEKQKEERGAEAKGTKAGGRKRKRKKA